MMKCAGFALAVLFAGGLVGPAVADQPLAIPPLVVDPKPSPSIWNGLYVGSGVTAAFAKGQKGQFGGDVFAGYDRTFDNHLVLGLRFDTGYAPFLTPSGRFHGFDFAMGEAKVGYEFGRVVPYIYAGGGFARATAFDSPLPNAETTINGLFSGSGFTRGVTTAGVGVDYHVTDNLTVGVSARVVKGPGGPEAGF